jgi:hypothetical protein
VTPLRALIADGDGPTGPQVVRDKPLWDDAIFLQKLAHQFERLPPVFSTSMSTTSPSASTAPRDAVTAIADLGHHQWFRLKLPTATPLAT